MLAPSSVHTQRTQPNIFQISDLENLTTTSLNDIQYRMYADRFGGSKIVETKIMERFSRVYIYVCVGE